MLKKTTKKENINFLSANKKDTVQGWIYSSENVTPKAIVQLSHGMCEYIARYDDFAEFLVENGYIVCGNDHIGHGETSGTTGVDGFFAPKDGDKALVADLKTVNDMAKKAYPTLPIILLGHSMGSFLARKYATDYPDSINALILSGTGGPNPLVNAGLVLTSIIGAIRGKDFRSKLVDNINFGPFCAKIENPTSRYDWVTNDKEILEAYKKDPKCTFLFTVSAYHDLARVNKDVNTQKWADGLNKDMPIYLFSGDMDPVGDYGKGVEKVCSLIKNAGVKDLQCKLYPTGMHEMLNAPNRHEVYRDVLTWLDMRF